MKEKDEPFVVDRGAYLEIHKHNCNARKARVQQSVCSCVPVIQSKPKEKNDTRS